MIIQYETTGSCISYLIHMHGTSYAWDIICMYGPHDTLHLPPALMVIAVYSVLFSLASTLTPTLLLGENDPVIVNIR